MTIERLGKYEIRGILGKGAMGTVYAAWDPIISRQVAIKTVRLPDAADIDAQEELARFKREAQAAGRLTHPNIVGIFDYGESDEVAYIVMEFVDGRTLKSVLDGEERMPVGTVARIMADLLAGLRYSHDRGVVHRDIKPANVMIVGGDGPGNSQYSGQAKIADFGIARIESSNLTQAGTIMGTPAYMSPEQFMGQTVDARTDIYSSGVLLFQLLTGERPFEGSMATIMHKALNTLPPKPSELSVTAPVALDAVVARAMARRPDDRYADAAAFAEAITSAMEGRAPSPPPEDGLGMGLGDEFDSESTVVRPTGRPAATLSPSPRDASSQQGAQPRPRSKAPLLAGVAVLALAAAGAGGAWWAGLIGTPEPPNPQLAGALSTVTPPGPVANTVVAVAPPSAPDVSPPTPSPQSTTAATPPTPPTALPTLPPPRTDVTQVVPSSTSPTETRPQAPQQAQIVPPIPPPPSPTQPRTDLAGAPPLEPARVAPPVTASIPPLQPRPAESQPDDPATRPGSRPEPAVVTPPVTAAPVTVSPPRPERIEPAPIAPATTATDGASAAPIAPPPARAPEPPVATAPPPAPAIVPPETPSLTTGITNTPGIPPVSTPPTSTPPVSTPPIGTGPTVTAAVVSPEALRRAVTAATQAADCAAVHGDLSRSGIISMQGVVGQGAPTQDLMRHLRDAAPTAPLDWSVEEVTGPYCAALNLIRPYTRPFGSKLGGMDIVIKDNQTSLREDDEIDLVAQTPPFPAYLQIDYFSSDGSVLHVQNAAQGSPVFSARSSQSYRPGAVAPPFGTDLVISIASSVPLFNKGQTLPAEAEPYLRQLRTAMDAAIKRRADLAAGALVVHTSPKS